MNDHDFSRSFLRWTSRINNHTPRLQVEACCRTEGPEGAREFFLSAMCASEQMYGDRDLIHLPPSEFAMVFSPDDQFMFVKYCADERRNVGEVHRVGEVMSTQDGRGARIVEMSVAMVRFARVRELSDTAEVRQAILDNKVLNGRTEYLGDDGVTRVTLDYPVKICNVSNEKERWQVDTGAIVLPDFSAPAELAVGRMRLGYIVYNSDDWAEVILRRVRAGGEGGAISHFSTSRRLTARNRLFRVE